MAMLNLLSINLLKSCVFHNVQISNLKLLRQIVLRLELLVCRELRWKRRSSSSGRSRSPSRRCPCRRPDVKPKCRTAKNEQPHMSDNNNKIQNRNTEENELW